VDVRPGRRRAAAGRPVRARDRRRADALRHRADTGLDGALVAGAIAEQTDQVMRNLARVLELVGGGLQDVVAVRAYLTDWDDYGAFNAAYEPWFPERLPSRTCTGTSGLAAGASVEIDLVAWRADGWPAG
jgi:2-iminobutanoate/2-iminopropanoate deaminase